MVWATCVTEAKKYASLAVDMVVARHQER